MASKYLQYIICLLCYAILKFQSVCIRISVTDPIFNNRCRQILGVCTLKRCLWSKKRLIFKLNFPLKIFLSALNSANQPLSKIEASTPSKLNQRFLSQTQDKTTNAGRPLCACVCACVCTRIYIAQTKVTEFFIAKSL